MGEYEKDLKKPERKQGWNNSRWRFFANSDLLKKCTWKDVDKWY